MTSIPLQHWDTLLVFGPRARLEAMGENFNPLQELEPLGVVMVLYFATTVLTEVMSNNSTAVLMVPIAVSTAATLGYDARTFLMAVTFGASASFLTPMGYKTNAMVYGPGGYRFMDFIRTGLPLKVVVWLVTILPLPLFWPFTRL